MAKEKEELAVWDELTGTILARGFLRTEDAYKELNYQLKITKVTEFPHIYVLPISRCRPGA
jgi:hypothetical protein